MRRLISLIMYVYVELIVFNNKDIRLFLIPFKRTNVSVKIHKFALIQSRPTCTLTTAPLSIYCNVVKMFILY